MKQVKRKQWLSLNHKFWKLYNHLDLKGKKIVLAISGGQDSVVLLDLFSQIQGIQIIAVYIHHGGKNNYRSKAGKFCKKICKEKGIQFEQLGPPLEILKSEADLRNFRMMILEKFLNEKKFDYVAFAHHQSDVLESRLINLIRGSSNNGLKSLKEINVWKLRPLLSISKYEIQEYCEERNLQFLEDPSNKDLSFLRNWIRNDWLPRLEAKRPGSVHSLARSLENLKSEKSMKISSNKLNLSKYWTFSVDEQIQAISQLVSNCGYKSFSLGQLKEIKKLLDNSKKDHRFKLGPMNWTVNAGLIVVEMDQNTSKAERWT